MAKYQKKEDDEGRVARIGEEKKGGIEGDCPFACLERLMSRLPDRERSASFTIEYIHHF